VALDYIRIPVFQDKYHQIAIQGITDKFIADEHTLKFQVFFGLDSNFRQLEPYVEQDNHFLELSRVLWGQDIDYEYKKKVLRDNEVTFFYNFRELTYIASEELYVDKEMFEIKKISLSLYLPKEFVKGFKDEHNIICYEVEDFTDIEGIKLVGFKKILANAYKDEVLLEYDKFYSEIKENFDLKYKRKGR
jgi:hypothetical protein